MASLYDDCYYDHGHPQLDFQEYHFKLYENLSTYEIYRHLHNFPIRKSVIASSKLQRSKFFVDRMVHAQKSHLYTDLVA